MTSLLDQPTDLDRLEAPDLDHLADDPSQRQPEELSTVTPAALGLAVVSGALSASGAAWMVGGMFRGVEARLVGLLGVVIGAGLVFLATRLRSAALQYLVLPAALLAGAVLMSSASGAGTSSLPALVKDAATSSQVLQPPIDFAPGWRLILVVVLALLSSAACALALSLNRPRLAVAVPAPLTVVAALVQPGSTAITTSAVSVGLVMMALATSYAADGVGDSFDARFELRRLARSVIAGILLVAALIAASKVSFLFPEKDSHHVVPPRRPPVSPPQPDVPLFTVKGALPGPLGLGVIDVYDVKQHAWLLPPIDNQRLKRLHLPTDLPGAPVVSGTPVRVTVTVEQARGHALPTVAGARHLDGGLTLDFDPRTLGLSLPERPVFTGLHYDITANPAPNGQQLSAVKGDVPPAIREFLAAPPTPPSVQALLAKAPQAPYARIQSLRAALYRKFTAAGAGKPTDVSADRVVELLNGGTGNPYELTAAEALLARWSGVPSRMAFGYYNGTPRSDGSVEFRPANAATYLEVYLAPYGWVPVVGVPPRAQQSLSNNQRNNDSSIQASPELGINVYLPVRQANRLPLYAYARYFLVRALPVVFGLGALLLLYPVALKKVRRRRRARWAAAHGPAGAIAVAYCSVRDQMIDLALPGRGLTPLELVEVVAEDEEHAELAWLTTRALWGDLRGELTDEEVAAAVRLAESVRNRLTKAQPETARLLAAVSRASLKAPHSAEIPNAWWRLRLPRPRLRLGRLRPTATAVPVLLAFVMLTVAGCSSPASARTDPQVPFPARLAPTAVAGLLVQEEPKAAQAYLNGALDKNVIVSEGKVLSFNKNGLVQAALQVAQLKRGYISSDKDVVAAITRSVGNVRRLAPQASHALYYLDDGSQRIYVWFPTVKSMALLVVRAQINAGAAEALARSLINYGDGGDIDAAALSAAFATTDTTTPTGEPSK
ncbi:MAG: transglutaminase-like domain-containing protein [Actinomycetota bacterium]|nr:transglutaminase-like domain-containing protein [Actinomycetota bacterium]